MGRVESIEKWLDSHGAAHKLQTIDLSKVDRAASHRNQARIGAPVNEDIAVMYAAAMEAGDEFPPLVVASANEKGDRYLVVDGNHRVAAYDLSDTHKADAYILNGISDAQRAALTFEANTKHGLPTALQERLRQAVYLVEMGTTHTEAARMLSLPLHRVRAAVERQNTDKRLQSLGVERWDRIAATARQRLYNIRSDKVMKAAAELAVSTKMTGADIDSLVSRINAASRGDDIKQMAVVEDEARIRKNEIRVTAGGRVGWSRPAMALSAALTRVVRLDPTVLKDDSIGADMRKQLKARTLEAIHRLTKVAEAL